MKEHAQREQLWSSGVVKSTRMAPRACQDCISMEEVNSICKWVSHLCSWFRAHGCHMYIHHFPSQPPSKGAASTGEWSAFRHFQELRLLSQCW